MHDTARLVSLPLEQRLPWVAGMDASYKTIALIVVVACCPGVSRAQAPAPMVASRSHGAPSDLPPPGTVRFAPSPEVVAPGTPVVQAARTFSLAEAEQIALGSNPTIRLAAARVEAARGRWVQGGLPPNPTAGFQGTEIGDSGKAGQLGFYVGQEVVTGGKLRLNRSIATAEIAREDAQLAAQRLRVLTDVRAAFFDVLVAQRRVEIASELVRIGERGESAAGALLRGMQASRPDYLQARVELNSARMLLDNSRTAHEGAWQQLVAVMGLPGMVMLPAIGDLHSMANNCTFDEVLSQLLSNSPELGAAYASVDRARNAIARARVEWRPNVDLQAGAQHDNASGFDIVNVQMGRSKTP